MTEPIAGILGGMGPAATAAFYSKLIERTPADRDQDHLRVAIWADPKVPDRVAALLDDGPDPVPFLAEGARHLQNLGVTAVAIPCHTAHAFLPRLVQQIDLPFLDMVSETVQELEKRQVQQVALLATRGTVASGIYQRRLRGFDVVLPDDLAQQRVDRAIAAVKAGSLALGGRYLAAAIPDVPLTVLACTELPLAAAQMPESGAQLLDPTDLLVDALLRACR